MGTEAGSGGRRGGEWSGGRGNFTAYQLNVPFTQKAQLGKRLKAAAEHINTHHDVDGLCKEFPERMHDLVHVAKGDKLQK